MILLISCPITTECVGAWSDSRAFHFSTKSDVEPSTSDANMSRSARTSDETASRGDQSRSNALSLALYSAIALSYARPPNITVSKKSFSAQDLGRSGYSSTANLAVSYERTQLRPMRSCCFWRRLSYEGFSPSSNSSSQKTWRLVSISSPVGSSTAKMPYTASAGARRTP